MAQRPKQKRPGRPPKPAQKLRKKRMILRANDTEMAEIERRAAQQKMPVATYVRRTAVRGWVRRIEAVDLFIDATFEIQEACRAFRDRPEFAAELERIDAALSRIRQQIPRL